MVWWDDGRDTRVALDDPAFAKGATAHFLPYSTVAVMAAYKAHDAKQIIVRIVLVLVFST